MSKQRNYHTNTIAAMQRLFSAVDMLVAEKKIRGINTYCVRYGIDRRNYLAQKKDLKRGFFEVSWLIPLVTDFGLSADWVLTGQGTMHPKKSSENQTEIKRKSNESDKQQA